MAAGSSVTLSVQSIVKKERSPMNVACAQLTSVNVDAQMTLWDALKTATDAIIHGVSRHDTVRYRDILDDSAMPVSNEARREKKLLVRYTGDTDGKEFRLEIPTPDLTLLTMESGNANFVNIADAGVMAQWVADFEAFAKAPDNGLELVTVQSVQFVGRNI